jgi:hypothetical protein
MRWFKCLDPQSPVMMQASRAVGKHGVWECVMAVAEAMEQEVDTLDVEMVSSWGSVKRDRAEKLLPHAQKILSETLKICRKSFRNVPQISENLPDFEPETRAPVISNINNLTTREEKEQTHTDQTACPRFDELLKIYPKVREPERCLSIWQLKGLESIADKVISTVNVLIKSDQWKEQNGRFVPALPKFLEDDPWNDGLMPSNRKSIVTELIQALKAGKPLRGKWEGGRVYRPEEVELVDSGGQYQIRIAGEGDFSLGLFAIDEQEETF